MKKTKTKTKFDGSCLAINGEKASNLASELSDVLVTYMKKYQTADICPTCALYSISAALGISFNEHTSIANEEIVQVAITGLATSLGIHTEFVDEGHVH